jgi:hypothetical protein
MSANQESLPQGAAVDAPPVPSFCRNFAPEVDQLAGVWSTAAITSDQWVPTGRKWGTNSQPFEVRNQNNLRGVAKPGDGAPSDKCLRAAHEKIVSDLAYTLRLPVPPVTLWDRGDGVAFRWCAVSAWAFQQPIEWHIQLPKLTPEQIKLAGSAAGAMRAFDTWVGAQDRKNDHVLVSDDADKTTVKLAYIDYAFSLSYEWMGVAGAAGEPRAAFPTGIGIDQAAITATVAAIEALPEPLIAEIVNRVPAGCFIDNARDVIMANLITRRGNLRGWLGLAAA